MSCERALSADVMDGRPIASIDRMIWQCCNAHQPVLGRMSLQLSTRGMHQLTRNDTDRLRYGCNLVGGNICLPRAYLLPPKRSQSALMPAVLIAFAHFSKSAATNWP